MATLMRGSRDSAIDAVKDALEAYEREHPGAVATLYRQNNVSIYIRVVDERFRSLSKGERHDQLWDFLRERVDDDTMQDIALLLLFVPSELKSSFMNAEFNDPESSSL